MANRTRDPNKEQYWRQIVAEWSGSGDSVRSFCRARRLSEASFYAWRRMLTERDCEQERRRRAPAFVPVRVLEELGTDASSGTCHRPVLVNGNGLEVVIASGQVVRVSR